MKATLAYSLKPERLQVPEHFQDRITQVGGLNRYMEPNFKLAWAQTELWESKQGGEWETSENGDIGGFKGYKDVLKGDGHPHWMLLQWVDAGKSIEGVKPESADEFYAANKCPKTGMQLLGEYQYKGSYQIVLPLVAKIWTGRQLYIESFPLSTEIINMMIPIIKGCMKISVESKMKFMKDEKEKKDIDDLNTFEDAYLSVKRKPTLAATPWLEDRQRKMESLCNTANAAFVTRMQRNRFGQGKINHKVI